MSIQLYRNVSVICFVLSGLMFILSVVLFFRLNIAKVIGDLTGNTARKEIKNIYEKNTQSSNRRNKPKPVYVENKGVYANANLSQSSVAQSNKAGIDLNEQKFSGQSFRDENETTLLVNDKLNNDSYKENFSDITESLEDLPNLYAPNEESKEYELELDITYLHTNEIIL
jgi:hypothetical protein